MPINGIEQPEFINIASIDDALRLRRFDGSFGFALEWYQDTELVYLVDGDRTAYTPDRLERMYSFLDGIGELYFIEVRENGRFIPIGDVTFLQTDMPIVIGVPEYRGRGIGRRVIAALAERGRLLGYDRLYVREIYSYNEGSKRCFESAGFRECEKTEAGARYVLELT